MRSIWVAILALVAFQSLSARAHAENYQVAAAKVDITPKGPIWLAGYADRKKPSEGIYQHLFLKALVVQDGKSPPLVLIAVDLIGFPRQLTDEIANRLQSEFGVPRQNFLMVASHTHTGPVIYSNLKTMFDLQGKDQEVVEAYTRELADRAVSTVRQAVHGLKPARLFFGRGRATFAANRRVFRERGVTFGANLYGAVDHEVPVLRIEDLDGVVRAVVFGYACHCTTLTGSWNQVGGDWAGYAQEFLERAYPEATALFVTGCGADANPEPRGKLEHAQQHGLEMAGAVTGVLTRSRLAVNGKLLAAFEAVDLPLASPPSRDDFEKRLRDPSVFVQRHARRQLQILERDGKLPTTYPAPVQVWQLGKDLTLVALGGEVVVDYALRIKREVTRGNIWVAGYSNDVFAYVPSVRVLLEGGYEADQSMIYYGLPTRFSNAIEETLMKKVLELLRRVQP